MGTNLRYSPLRWDVRTKKLYMGQATVGFNINGAFTDGIKIDADGTTGVNITSSFTGTTGFLLAGTATTGVSITGACTTPVSITGAFTTGISIAADGTTAIGVTNAFTGTTMLSLAGTAADGIIISGACSDNGIEISGTCTDAAIDIQGTQTAAGLLVSGTAADGIVISGACSDNGIEISGACGTAIDISAVQTDETGWDNAAVIKHGTYSTALAYGTQTDHLVMNSMHITAGATGKYVMGDICMIETSATSTGYFVGNYAYLVVAHTVGAAIALYAEVDVTATAALNGNVQGLYCEINVDAGTITGAGKISGITVEVDVESGATVAQPIHGIEVDMRGIKVDVAGETIGIKVTMADGSNYLDYGMQFSNCFNTATAVINFDLTQGATACVLLVESGAHTITNFISITGIVTNFADFVAGASGTHCLFANVAIPGVNTSHALQIDISGTPHYIPVYSDLSWAP